jgi:hypothetical protein
MISIAVLQPALFLNQEETLLSPHHTLISLSTPPCHGFLSSASLLFQFADPCWSLFYIYALSNRSSLPLLRSLKFFTKNFPETNIVKKRTIFEDVIGKRIV